jgi:hypothetical protein
MTCFYGAACVYAAIKDSPVPVTVPPPASPSAADRFSSPIHPSQAKRRLFDTTSSSASTAASSSTVGSPVPQIPMALITDKSGRQVVGFDKIVFNGSEVCLARGVVHEQHKVNLCMVFGVAMVRGSWLSRVAVL